jgi:hypothetical protein
MLHVTGRFWSQVGGTADLNGQFRSCECVFHSVNCLCLCCLRLFSSLSSNKFLKLHYLGNTGYTIAALCTSLDLMNLKEYEHICLYVQLSMCKLNWCITDWVVVIVWCHFPADLTELLPMSVVLLLCGVLQFCLPFSQTFSTPTLLCLLHKWGENVEDGSEKWHIKRRESEVK